MRFNFTYRGIPISRALEGHTVLTFEKLSEYFGNVECRVVFRVKESKTASKPIHICEVTIKHGKHIFRSEQKSNDMYKSVCYCADKIWVAINKHKSKVDKKRRDNAKIKYELKKAYPFEGKKLLIKQEFSVDDSVYGNEKFKVKTINPIPLSVDEAIEAMENVGHDFFIFINDLNDQVSVVYRRDKDKYGNDSYGLLTIKSNQG